MNPQPDDCRRNNHLPPIIVPVSADHLAAPRHYCPILGHRRRSGAPDASLRRIRGAGYGQSARDAAPKRAQMPRAIGEAAMPQFTCPSVRFDLGEEAEMIRDTVATLPASGPSS